MDTQERDPVELLAEQFVRGLRDGERLDICHFQQQFPEHAQRIGELFPLLAAVEGLWDRPAEGLRTQFPSQIGEYRVIREIGRGGMGIVYEAEQPKLHRRVALKVLPPLAAGNPESQKRLRDEAQALAKLEHANIVPIFEVGNHDGHPYFCMQFIRGASLAERLRGGPMPQREAALILLPVCRAMALAHQRGVVHRDLKPSNILMDPDGRPLVADFGLARFVSQEHLTQSGALVGTPSYMSPEQAARANHVSAATDIYSLGAVLYEMLTGRPPFQAPSPMETIMMVLEDTPLSPRALNNRISKDLEAIVNKCLSKDPNSRYATAEELADELQAYLCDEPVSATRFHFSDLLAATKRETRFADNMYRLSLEWMFLAVHGLIIFLVFAFMKWRGFEDHLYYYAAWAASTPPLALVLRVLERRHKKVTLIQRQITSVAMSSAAICVLTFIMEGVLHLPVLILSPIFSIVAFGQFMIFGNLLSGVFYPAAVAFLLCTAAMMVLARLDRPDLAMALYAVTHFAAFFGSGWIFHRRRREQVESQSSSKESSQP